MRSNRRRPARSGLARPGGTGRCAQGREPRRTLIDLRLLARAPEPHQLVRPVDQGGTGARPRHPVPRVGARLAILPAVRRDGRRDRLPARPPGASSPRGRARSARDLLRKATDAPPWARVLDDAIIAALRLHVLSPPRDGLFPRDLRRGEPVPQGLAPSPDLAFQEDEARMRKAPDEHHPEYGVPLRRAAPAIQIDGDRQPPGAREA